jgi:hypothetical protein
MRFDILILPQTANVTQRSGYSGRDMGEWLAQPPGVPEYRVACGWH